LQTKKIKGFAGAGCLCASLGCCIFNNSSFHAVKPNTMSYYWLSLPSMIEELPRLRDCIGAIARIEGYSDAFTPELELTIHEAFVNAVRHGNHGNTAFSVTITLEAGEVEGKRFLEVRVQDCGEGFHPERAIAVICSGRNANASGGRGLLFVDRFVESYRIEQASGGCVVVLRYIPY
jgi:serine/threonine-protein kinase RsbW